MSLDQKITLLRGSASAWLEANLTESMLQPNPANEASLLTVVRLMESADRKDEALHLLQDIVTFAKSGGRVHILIQADVALSLIAEQPDALIEALRLAEPEGYISTFLDEGEPMRNLFRHVLTHTQLEPDLKAYVEKLLSAFEPAPRKPKPRTRCPWGMR